MPFPFHICVLIPCYNNLPGLLKSLKSIEFEPGKLLVLVVDDGSLEPVLKEKVSGSLNPGLALEVINLPENSGITAALNRGLAWIVRNLDVKYIARLDCGDTCHSDRFYQQAGFMDDHPEIGLTGTWCKFEKPGTSFQYTYTTPVRHQEIVSEMHLRNVFIHPTVMFRTALLPQIGFYPANYPHAEDYAFFMKMLTKTKTAIIDKFLILCEINQSGISIRNRRVQLQTRAKVVEDFGTSPLLKFAGLTRLLILRLLPYRLILLLKK